MSYEIPTELRHHISHSEAIFPVMDTRNEPKRWTKSLENFVHTPSPASEALDLIDSKGPAPKLGTFKTRRTDAPRRRKYNSTETLFVRNIIMAPDIDEIVYCIARRIVQTLRSTIHLPEPERISLVIFDERKRKLFNKFQNVFPNFLYIHKFLSKLFTSREISAECGVMAMAYADRLLQLTGLTFDKSNWRPVVFTAILLASKVWEDASVWNADYAEVFKGLSVENINSLEREFLMKINFKLGLSSSDYTRYYFELRSLAAVSEENFPVKPLDKRTAAELEARCTGAEEKIKKFHLHASKCLSLDMYQGGQAAISIEDLRGALKRNMNLEKFS